MIRFGLGAVKGVGEGAVEVIKQAREQGGAMLSLFDFCRRVDGRKVNRKVIEALVKAGAFDGSPSRTASAARGCSAPSASPASAPPRRSATARAARPTSWRCSRGGGERSPAPATDEDKYPAFEEWMPKEVLAYEKEALGFYISGHPLDRYASEIRRFTNATAANCTEKGERAEVILAGVVAVYQERPMKNGQGKIRLLHAGGPVRPDRVHRQLEEGRGVPRDPLEGRAAAGDRHRRHPVRRR